MVAKKEKRKKEKEKEKKKEKEETRNKNLFLFDLVGKNSVSLIKRLLTYIVIINKESS